MADDIQVMHEATDLNTALPLNNKQVDAANDIGVIIPSAEVLITDTIDAAQSSSQKSSSQGQIGSCSFINMCDCPLFKVFLRNLHQMV